MRTTAATAVMLSAANTALAQFTGDPFSQPIPLGNRTAQLLPFAVIPNSNGQSARMNLLAPAYDGSGRLFLNDQRGPMYAISPDGSTVTGYLDIRDADPSLTGGGEGGFQGFVFHPDFADNGRFYTLHGTSDTETPTFPGPSGLQQVLLEWTADDPAADTFAGTRREVLRIQQPLNNHYGAGLAFNRAAGPGDPDDGLLYVSFGDGGGGGDPFELADNPAAPNGKVLRIDPTPGPAGQPYTVPNDNPFLDDPAFLPEIFAQGLRNTQRISFDPAGILTAPLMTDIGQGVIEEVNVLLPGADYGWDRREGTFQYINGGTVAINPTPAGLTDPIAEYDHSEGNAITAGYVLRSALPTALEGSFLFGDIANGRIFYLGDIASLAAAPPQGGQGAIRELRLLDENGNPDSLLGILNSNRADLRFGIGPDDTIYVLNKRDGVVRRLLPADLGCSPADLDSSGSISFADATAFIDAFNAAGPAADINDDGLVNFADVTAFIEAFNEGCP